MDLLNFFVCWLSVRQPITHGQLFWVWLECVKDTHDNKKFRWAEDRQAKTMRHIPSTEGKLQVFFINRGNIRYMVYIK